MKPRYPIYIPTKGRFDRKSSMTINVLQKYGVPFFAVVEPQEREKYLEIVDEENLLVLPFSNLGKGAIPARNWCKDHAISSSADRHWQLDDNILEFRRLWKGRRIPCHAGVALRVCEDLTDRYANVGLSGLNYQMFVPGDTPVPFYRNVHVYSCVAPDTPILCADLTWRSAGSLEPGRELVAFDEEPFVDQGRMARKYRTAVVESNKPTSKPCYQVETDIGSPVTASDEHPWLVFRPPPLEKRRGDRGIGEESGRPGRLCWVDTKNLRVGDRLAHLSRPWKYDESHDGGWISGMFDGEGSLVVRERNGRTCSAGIGISQLEGPVLERLRAALIDRGYSAATHDTGGRGTYIRGGFPEALRFAGEFQPTRIMNRVATMWEGRKVWQGSTYEVATVTSLEPVGLQPVASITTSTGTFITGGYLTHNCTLINHAMTYGWRLRYNDDTDICLQALTGGWCTILVNAFMANKMRTLTMKGGMTDEMYRRKADADVDPSDTLGRFEMARFLERAWPGLVKTRRRFGRWQHTVNWGAFRGSPKLELRPDFDPRALPLVDEYGLTLRAVKVVKSPALRQILDEWEIV